MKDINKKLIWVRKQPKSITTIIHIDLIIGEYLDLTTLNNISTIYNIFEKDLNRRKFPDWNLVKNIHTNFNFDKFDLIINNIDNNDLQNIILDKDNISSITRRNLDELQENTRDLSATNPELRIKLQLLRYTTITIYYKKSSNKNNILLYGGIFAHVEKILGYIVNIRISDRYKKFKLDYVDKFIDLSNEMLNIIYTV